MSFKKNFVSIKIFGDGEIPQLTADLEYFDDSIGVIVVPKGFKTDKHTLPSILHDYLYDCGYKYRISRKQADKIFYDAMIKNNVARITANVMWFCVRAFARKHYNKGV